jgi:Protein of unknown function (DUF1064)
MPSRTSVPASKWSARSKLGWIKRRASGKAKNPASNWLSVNGNTPFRKSKRGKFNAAGRRIGDHWFPSKAEADRFEQLFEMLERGMIADLEIQVPYPCHVNGQLVCTYLADFRYRTRPRQLGSRVLIEEVKGMRTGVYEIKRKLVQALHRIEIIELKVPKRGGVSAFRFLTADQFGAPARGEGHVEVGARTPGGAGT